MAVVVGAAGKAAEVAVAMAAAAAAAVEGNGAGEVVGEGEGEGEGVPEEEEVAVTIGSNTFRQTTQAKHWATQCGIRCRMRRRMQQSANGGIRRGE